MILDNRLISDSQMAKIKLNFNGLNKINRTFLKQLIVNFHSPKVNPSDYISCSVKNIWDAQPQNKMNIMPPVKLSN